MIWWIIVIFFGVSFVIWLIRHIAKTELPDIEDFNKSKIKIGDSVTISNIYELLGFKKGCLVAEKQIAYGDSFGRAGLVMKELYPNGISLDQMEDALVVVRILDKLFRIANRKDAFGESPYGDIQGYGLLGERKDIAG